MVALSSRKRCKRKLRMKDSGRAVAEPRHHKFTPDKLKKPWMDSFCKRS